MEKKPKKSKPEAPPKKKGRVGKYVQMGIAKKLDMIEGWARHGSTMAEIAKMLKIAEGTLYRWKLEHGELAEALRAGKPEADGEILNSAFKQAVGYKQRVAELVKLKVPALIENKETGKTELLTLANGSPVMREVAEVHEYDKYFPPDARVTMFMLVNRLKPHYQAKVETPEDPDANKVVYGFNSPPDGALSE